MMGSLFIDLVMFSIALFAITTDAQKSPVSDFCSVHEKSPCMMFVGQDDAMKIVAAEAVDPASSEMAFNNLVIDQALLHVTSGQDYAERTIPRMVMQAAIRVTGEETVDIGAAASWQAEQVVALQIRFALVSTDDAAAQQACDFKEQLVDEADFFTHEVTGW